MTGAEFGRLPSSVSGGASGIKDSSSGKGDSPDIVFMDEVSVLVCSWLARFISD